MVVVTPSVAVDLSNTAWERAGRKHGVDPYLLFSVALVESGKREERIASPWPWALNSPKGSTYSGTRAEAEKRLARLSAAERHQTAIGLMQIYVAAHGDRVPRLTDLLDPAVNLDLGADILKQSIATKPGDLELGVGRYNAWVDEAAARIYGRRVLEVYRRLTGIDNVGYQALWE